MKNILRKTAALLLALLLLLPGLSAADGTVTEKDGWHFDEKGFLTGKNPGKEYLLEDEENGYWQYASKKSPACGNSTTKRRSGNTAWRRSGRPKRSR